MEMLEGIVRHYDWGSTSEIPSLLGRRPDGRPWAELWLGAHPAAPSLVGHDARPLDEVIRSDPHGTLGPDVAKEFGTLPFLLKILAADAPLSIQVHPDAAQAVAGFEREDRAGIAVDAPNRSFRDRNHKPELICALTPFEMLCGFRDPHQSLGLFDTIPTSRLDPVRDELASGNPDSLRRLLGRLLKLPVAEARRLVDAVVEACRVEPGGDFAVERRMAVDLADRYPGDVGIVTALLLNHVRLEPGQALFLGAGNLHTYLRGTGVEIMANSDNVLRGGLTPKHVDVPGLLEVVDAVPTEPEVQMPEPGFAVTRYHSPVSEFSLSRVVADGDFDLDVGPAIVLCVDGCVDVGHHTLDRGSALWLPARAGVVEATGCGTVFRAGVGPAA